MKKTITNEETGIQYTLVGDYYLPNLTAPDKPDTQLGVWGMRRLDYLINHRRVLYLNLLTSGKLAEHLREIDTAAYEQHDTIVQQMAAAQGVIEVLKVSDQMGWVGRMNNIRACAKEIVLYEVVYI